MSGQPRHLLPSLAVALCGATWGAFWIPIRWFEDQGVGAGWISLVFCLVSVAAPLPWLLKRGAWAGVRNELLTGLLMGTGFTLYTVSLVLTDVVNAILLFYLAPIWGTLATWMALGERMNGLRLLAIAAGFLGTGLILGSGTQWPIPRNAGDWLALLSGVLWSLGGLNAFLRPAHGIALPVFCFSAGGAVASALVLLLALPAGLPLTEASGFWPALPLMMLMAMIVFVPPNFLVLWASQRLDPGRVGVLLMTEAIVGSITAALFAGESFGAWKAAGAVLILAAGLVELLSRAPARQAMR